MTTRILTENITSISELKANPMNAIASAHGQAVAVLNRNQPAFYAVPVELYEQMIEMIDNAELAQTVKNRQKQASVKVSLDDL